jgi:tRNA 2-thiouridine synthesizing protein A
MDHAVGACYSVRGKRKKERTKMNSQDLAGLEAAKVVDARGSACPGPLLEAKKGIGAVKVGEVLEIWSGDARTKEDIPRWATKVGHEYLGALEAEGYDRIFLRRSK